MILEFLVPFISILFAELGDKTQLAILSMSSKTKEYTKLFLGVFLAFLIVDGLAIFFGGILFSNISLFWAKIASGILFVIFGIIGFLKGQLKKELPIKPFKTPFITSFTLIALAELGDKSQLASAIYGGIFNPLLVLLGVMLALSILSITALYFGHLIAKKCRKEFTETLANSIFVMVGLFLLGGTIFL